jgi:hypothetical protein
VGSQRESLLAFPDVIQQMGKQPEWVQNVGDEFLGQPKAVMDSVQRLRHKAQDQGNLASKHVPRELPEVAPAPAERPRPDVDLRR